MATSFRLHTLGSLQLVAPDGEVVRPQPRRLALLALVAAAGERGAPRDKLLAWLSPERGSDAARHSLHQLLYYVRRQVGEDVFTGTDPLRLNSAILGCDLVDFEFAVQERQLERAAELYGGPFLDGFHLSESPEFDEWAAAERARLASRHAELLLTLAGDATARGDHRASVRWWQRLATVDPLSSSAALGLMRSLVDSGDAPAALVHARSHEQLVRSELGAAPDPELVAFVAAIHRLPGSSARTSRSVERIDVAPERDAPREFEQIPARPPRASRVALRKRWAWVAAGFVVAVTGGALLSLDGSAAQRETRAGSFSREHQILVGDFDAVSRDSLSARALSEALRGALQASRAIAVVSRAEVDRALLKMERPIWAHVNHALAHEIAVRNGYEAVLTGAITPLGSGHLLSVRLTTANGEEIIALSETASSDDALIPAVGRLSNALRRTIGESASAIDSVKPLEQVTTASLRALRLYMQAMDETRQWKGGAEFTFDLLRQAIALDSAFAMAHRFLGLRLYNADSTREALEELRLAVRYGERLTERERLSASSTLKLILLNYPTAAEEVTTLLQHDSTDLVAINHLVILSNFMGRYEVSRKWALKRARIDGSGRPYLVPMLLYQGQNEAALTDARRYFERYKGTKGPSSLAYARGTLAVTHVSSAAYDSAEFYAVPDGPFDAGSPHLVVTSRLARGRLRDAFHAMGARLSGEEFPTSRFSAAAEAHAALAEALILTDSLAAGKRLDRVLADRDFKRGNPANRRLNHILALAVAGRVTDARRELRVIENSFDGDVRVARTPELSLAKGAVELADGEVSQAIGFLRTAASMVSYADNACRVCALPWLGRAYEAAGQIDSAVVTYERYLTTGDHRRQGPDALWRAIALRRLGKLHAQRGDTARAVRRLEEFVALWSVADSVLQPHVTQARERIAELHLTQVAAGATPSSSRP